MQLSTTISSKGQVVIPKSIRNQLNLSPTQKLTISLENQNIILKPTPSTKNVFGMFKPKTPLTKSVIKQAYKKAVNKKSSP